MADAGLATAARSSMTGASGPMLRREQTANGAGTPPRRKERLFGDFRTRVALVAVGIALAVGLLLTGATIARQKRGAEATQARADTRAVRSLALYAAPLLDEEADASEDLAHRRSRAREVARGLLLGGDVTRVALFRGDELFAGADASRDDQGAALPPIPPPSPPATVERCERVPRDALGSAVRCVAPISVAHRTGAAAQALRPTVGSAVIYVSRDHLLAQLDETAAESALLLAFAVLLALLASILLTRLITRPIQRLTAAAERVGAGRLDVELPIESNDAIGVLSATFNKMARDLNQLEESKKKFLAVVSHELRTPLVPIRGYLQLARRGGLGVLPEAMKKPLEVMERNVHRLGEHVETLLLFSVVAAGELPIALVRCDLCECVRDAIERIRPRATEHGHRLEAELCEGPLTVRGDPVRLGQIFDNLLSNADKFSRDGGRIRVRTRRGDDRAVVEVTDQGIGIPEELRGKIFERFYQVHAAFTRPYPGVGLGLAIALELVTRHGGTLGVDSRVDEGSTFRVELPLDLTPPVRSSDRTLEGVEAVGAQ